MPGHILVRSHLPAQLVPNPSANEVTWKFTCVLTQVSDHFIVICVQRLSARRVTWRPIFEHMSIRRYLVVIHVERCLHISLSCSVMRKHIWLREWQPWQMCTHPTTLLHLIWIKEFIKTTGFYLPKKRKEEPKSHLSGQFKRKHAATSITVKIILRIIVRRCSFKPKITF